eukprot:g30656.t1
MTELADILPIFSSYASNANEVDGRSSCLLCKDCGLFDRNFSSTDADLIFARVVPKGQRRISITEFEKDGEVRSVKRPQLEMRHFHQEDVMQKVADSAGPSLEGTKADAVRLHDDKQTYTGVHARGGPDSVPKGYGHVPGTSSLTLGRRDSKDRRSLSRTPSGAACPLPNLLASGPAVERKLSRNMAGREHERVDSRPAHSEGLEGWKVGSALEKAATLSRREGCGLLENVFEAYCSPGHTEMDGKGFAKLMKDSKMVPLLQDADLTFAKVVPKGMPSASFEAGDIRINRCAREWWTRIHLQRVRHGQRSSVDFPDVVRTSLPSGKWTLSGEGRAMGAVRSAFSASPRRQVVFVGLDAAGKSTMLQTMKQRQGGRITTQCPTLGFEVETLELSGSAKFMTIHAWDVGGRHKLRVLLRLIYKDADAIIFVLDSSDREMFESARAELMDRLVRMQRMTKIVRMLRLVKLTQLTERLNLDTYIQRYKVVAVLNTLFGLVWAVHVMACGWYLCAALHADPLETWLARRHEMLLNFPPLDQWAHSMYFVFAVFTTVGFGDISAFTTGEIIYCTLTMMVGAIVHSLIVGQVISEVTSDNTVNAFLKNKLKLAKEFAAHANLDAAGSKALSLWLETNARDLMTEQFKLDEMHQLLHGRLFKGQLVRNGFLRVPFVVTTPPRLQLLLSLALTPKFYENGHLLYHAGDSAFHMFLVLSGTFAFVARPERPSKSPRANEMWPYQLFSHNSYFGNFELHGGVKQFRRCNARCESEKGQALRLPREHYSRLCGEFPQFCAAWYSECLRREALRCRLLEMHTKMLNYRVLAARRLQRYFRSVKEMPRSWGADWDQRKNQDDDSTGLPSEIRRHSWHSSSGEMSASVGTLSVDSMLDQSRGLEWKSSVTRRASFKQKCEEDGSDGLAAGVLDC